MLLKLLSKKQEAGDVRTYVFGCEQEIGWKAGQYMRYRIPNEAADERGVMRYFTNSAAPFEGHIQISTRYPEVHSSFKNDLEALSIGGEIQVNGPFGDFTLDQPSGEYVFIAGGIGITPFRAILLQLAHEGKPLKISLLYGNRSEDTIVFKEELEQLAAKNPDFKIAYAIGNQLIDESFIHNAVEDAVNKTFYLSGPEPMVKGIEQTLLKMGVREEQIKTDYFPGYDGI